MKVYINYPDSHLTIHQNPNCPEIQKHQKTNQRLINVTSQNLISILMDFINKTHKFSSTASENDMWLELNLNSSQHNIGLVFTLQAILGQFYQPLSNAPVIFHC